jgi:hypothetical protein
LTSAHREPLYNTCTKSRAEDGMNWEELFPGMEIIDGDYFHASLL